jgi:hypothetical protein
MKRRPVTVHSASEAANVRAAWLAQDLNAFSKRFAAFEQNFSAQMNDVTAALAKLASVERVNTKRAEAEIRALSAAVVKQERRAAAFFEKQSAAVRAAEAAEERKKYTPTPEGLNIDGALIPWRVITYADKHIPDQTFDEADFGEPSIRYFESEVCGVGRSINEDDGLRVTTENFEGLIPWGIVRNARNAWHNAKKWPEEDCIYFRGGDDEPD